MHEPRVTRVKICCIQSIEEARMAVRAGASALGLVSRMPSGPGVIMDEQIRDIAGTVPPGVTSVLLTSEQHAEAIIAQQRRMGTSAIQLVDRLTHGTHSDIRLSLPGIKLIQVVHVTGRESIDEAMDVSQHVDAILLDSGNPALATKELGGTGRVHDWNISRQIRERIPIPMFLAGGLTPENVSAAIRSVGPYGVDVCNGVRTGGNLDRNKLTMFLDQVFSQRSG